MLVVLRLALGWHFLYEGVWKLTHHDAFLGETEGFLSVARGPAGKFFNGLVPDIDGQKRLEYDLEAVDVKDSQAAGGKPAKQPRLATRWEKICDDFIAFYRPKEGKDENGDLYKKFVAAANKVCNRHIDGLEKFIRENGETIKAHFDSFRRFNEQVKSDPSTDFMRQRRWDQLQEYRKEVKGWTADLDAREKALRTDLMDLLNKHRPTEAEAVVLADAKDKEKAAAAKKAAAADESQSPTIAAGPKPSDRPRDMSDAAKSEGAKKSDAAQAKPKSAETSKAKTNAKAEAKSPPRTDAAVALVDFSPLAQGHDPAGPFREGANPFKWPQMEQMAFVLSWGMAAIGFCLMIGLFTRLSALAGAAFMLCVVLSQPSYPGVYPPDVPQLGHALLVNKDFVEMVALLVIASTSLGRWTGMDFFLSCCGCCCKGKGKGEKA